MRNKPLILLDLDGVVVDLLGALWAQVAEYGRVDGFAPDLPAEQLTWNIEPEHAETAAAVKRAFREPGLFARPEPIPGALDAIRKLRKEADVFFCTSPFIGNPTCASDKLAWVERHVGKWAPSRTILAVDKHLVRGDVLIDDRPELHSPSGEEAIWRHLLFSQPYNRHMPGPRLDGWHPGAVDEVLEFAVAR